MKIIVIVLIMTSSFKLLAVELNFKDVIFKNSNNEYFSSKDDGNKFKKLRFVDNVFKNQKYISTVEKTFISNDKGLHWDEDYSNKVKLESNEFSNLKIYPNPTSKYFSISSDTYILDVEIFNIFGSSVKKISKLKSKLELINIEELNPGSYLIRIKTEDGVQFQKVLISK